MTVAVLGGVELVRVLVHAIVGVGCAGHCGVVLWWWCSRLVCVLCKVPCRLMPGIQGFGCLLLS
jgi:hypothetical protein